MGRIYSGVAALRWPALVLAAITGEIAFAAGTIAKRAASAIVPAYALVGVVLLLAAKEANAPIMRRPLASLTVGDVVPSVAQLVAVLPYAAAVAALVAIVAFVNGSPAGGGALLEDVLRQRREDRARRAVVTSDIHRQGG